MTNEQIKAILDNAPEKATHIDINGHYWHNSSVFYWLCCDDGSTCVGDIGNSARKLADLREILKLREEHEALNDIAQYGEWTVEHKEARKRLRNLRGVGL